MKYKFGVRPFAAICIWHGEKMKKIITTLKNGVCLAVFCFGVFVVGASGATFTVNSLADGVDATGGTGACATAGGVCTLRAAIQSANAQAGADIINFSVTGTITLNTATVGGDAGITEGDLDITQALTITGPGARLLTIDQTTTDRVFDVDDGTGAAIAVTISDLTIFSGAEDGDGNDGGCVYNNETLALTFVTVSSCTSNGVGGGIFASGTTTISNSLIVGNSTTANDGDGGGIFNDTTLTMYNSTVANNTALANGAGAGGPSEGGGIGNSGTANLNNVTISSNQSFNNGGGLADTGTFNLRNTIVANNAATGAAQTNEDVNGSFTSQGTNLIEVLGTATGFVGSDITGSDPALGALANNGGPTDTFGFSVASPVWNQGNNCVTTSTCTGNNPPALTTDQRGAGFTRLAFSAVDIGAFELPITTAADAAISGRVTDAFGRAISSAAISVTDMGGVPKFVYTNTFGYYSVKGLEVGQTYILGVSARRYTFANPTMVVNLGDNVVGANFVAKR